MNTKRTPCPRLQRSRTRGPNLTEDVPERSPRPAPGFPTFTALRSAGGEGHGCWGYVSRLLFRALREMRTTLGWAEDEAVALTSPLCCFAALPRKARYFGMDGQLGRCIVLSRAYFWGVSWLISDLSRTHRADRPFPQLAERPRGPIRAPGAPFSQLKERWRCVSIGPVAMLRPPPGTSSQTQPDGRSVYSVFALRARPAGHRPSRRAPSR